MYQDGSRDLVIKDEWREKLNIAAGVQIAAAPKVEAVPAQPADEVMVLNDEDIIEVVEKTEAKAA
jgi:hypothetical protein